MAAEKFIFSKHAACYVRQLRLYVQLDLQAIFPLQQGGSRKPGEILQQLLEKVFIF